jgi:hypothetical protein
MAQHRSSSQKAQDPNNLPPPTDMPPPLPANIAPRGIKPLPSTPAKRSDSASKVEVPTSQTSVIPEPPKQPMPAQKTNTQAKPGEKTLMEQIREGKQLRSSKEARNTPSKQQAKPDEPKSLADSVSAAMAKRRLGIAGQDDETEDSDNWDD